jgi:uncharacterized protein YcbK (DUF882 family)
MLIKKYKKGSKEKLTRNFSAYEMDCKCNYPDCTETIVDILHMQHLQRKRDEWGKPITIISGYRCPKHNTDEGGVDDSQHVQGTATDIQVKGMSPETVQNECEDFNGLGRYKNFTHVDSRPTKARWGTTPNIPETKAKQEYLPEGPSEDEVNDKLKQIEETIKNLLGK